MRALFLTDGKQIPASRFRAEQFFPALRARGIECTLAPAYGDAYNDVHARRVVGPAYKLACRLKRAAQTLSSTRYDVVFLQRTALPYTAWPEVMRGRYGSPLVLDFDDALWVGPRGAYSALRDRAFRDAVGASDRVIAGNAYLAARAAAPEKTAVIPTSIDTDVYCPASSAHEGPVVVGWMGTASNFASLRSALRGIRRALERLPHARLRIVSNAALDELRGVPQVEQIRWTAETEVALLRSFDVGLMPLEDTDANRGKCAFKMIQYMAVGVPAIASAVGANAEVFGRDAPGILVAAGGSFEDAIVALAEDRVRRAAAGAAGRERAVSTYSVRVAEKALAAELERAAARGR